MQILDELHGIPRGTVSISEVLLYLGQDRLMDRVETAAYLSLSPRTLEGHTEIKRYRVGKKLLYRKSDIDQWLERFAEVGAPVEEKTSLRRALEDARRKALKEVAND